MLGVSHKAAQASYFGPVYETPLPSTHPCQAPTEPPMLGVTRNPAQTSAFGLLFATPLTWASDSGFDVRGVP